MTAKEALIVVLLALPVLLAGVYLLVRLIDDAIERRRIAEMPHANGKCPFCGYDMFVDPGMQHCPRCDAALYVDAVIARCPICNTALTQAGRTLCPTCKASLWVGCDTIIGTHGD